MLRHCAKCHLDKDQEVFYKNRSRPDGLDEYCKGCRKESNSIYGKTSTGKATRKVNRETYYSRHKTRLLAKTKYRKHGIDQEQYDNMLAKQNGVCAICKKPENKKNTKKLSIDHYHKTNKIRGLLCNKCNTGIGLLMDDPKILMAAVAYLKPA